MATRTRAKKSSSTRAKKNTGPKAQEDKETKKPIKTRKWPREGTIGRFVLEQLVKNPSIPMEDMGTLMHKKFPESKFNKAHLSWYKYQLRNKGYTPPKK